MDFVNISIHVKCFKSNHCADRRSTRFSNQSNLVLAAFVSIGTPFVLDSEKGVHQFSMLDL